MSRATHRVGSAAWSTPAVGLWVAARRVGGGLAHVGWVERVGDRYEAFDGRGHRLGSLQTLDAARAAVERGAG